MHFKTRSMLLALTLLSVAIAPGATLAGVGDIHPTSLPISMISLEDSVTISWLEPVQASLEYGPSAFDMLGQVNAYQSLVGELRFSPSPGGLTAGVWAARLVSGEDSSLPFYLAIESESVPAMISPQNGGVIVGASTTMAWEPVLGVPYYHVLLSDREIIIDEDENGDTVVSGADIIWQAITPATSIGYGALDPSGFFDDLNGTPPPLTAGSEYNWLVLNNYGNTPSLSSTRQAGVSAFTVAASVLATAPELQEPPFLAELDDATVTFEWEDVPEAAHFHYYLSRVIDDEDSQGSVPVFDQVTTQTLIDMPTAGMLIESRYQWKVFAIDEQGRGAVSETWEFTFHAPIGSLRIRTQDTNGGALSYADVQLIPLGGGGSSIPILTDSGGNYDDEFTPGGYLLTASKAGFEDASAMASLVEGETTQITLVLDESPAFLVGQVEGSAGQAQGYATVTATRFDGEVRDVQTNAGGDFQIGLSSGQWTISAAKTGYHFESAQTVTVAAGAYTTLSQPLQLVPNSSTLSGAVQTAGGQPIVAATVSASGPGGTHSVQTGNSGLYQFSLETGEWQVSVAKSGYVSGGQRSLSVGPGEDLLLDPPFTLSPAAAILSGFVRASGNIVSGATVTATPAAGQAVVSTSGPVGSFEFSLQPGTWMLSASSPGYSPIDPVQVTLQGGGSQTGIVLGLAANPCTVSGFVRDGSNGLANATVSNGGVEVLSAWDGSYSISLPAGAQTLQAWLSAHAGASSIIDLSPGQALAGVNFLLSPDAATVGGAVTSGGSPVAGATVTLASADGDDAVRQSGLSGQFNMSVAAGSYTLVVTRPGMLPSQELDIMLAAGQTLPNLAIQLQQATVALSGRVTVDGAPLRDAQVTATADRADASTSSNLDGEWTLVLSAGEAWRMSAAKSGYSSESTTTPDLGAGESWTHDFALISQPALISGVVRDDDGLPVAGAALAFSDGGRSPAQATTDGSGYYSLSMQPGNYSLAISKTGYAADDRALVLSVGARTLNLEIEARFASLSGFVLDEGGAPLSGATLRATGTGNGGIATSASDGAFVFPRLLAGDYTLSVSLAEYAGQSRALTLAEDEAAEQDWHLAAYTGILGGWTTNGAGAALTGVNLQVRDADGNLIAQTQSTANGSFYVPGLPVEAVSVSASRSGYHVREPNPIIGVLPPQGGLAFVLDANDGSIRGSVRGEDLSPIAGATVQVDDGGGYFGMATSAADGSFTIEGLRSATSYTLVADAPGWAAAQVIGLEPDGGDVDIFLAFANASLSGTLSSVDGDLDLPAGSLIRAIPSAASGSAVSSPLTGAGAYSLAGLKPGEYTVLLRADGYLSEPRSQLVAVAEGDEIADLDFALFAAAPIALSIDGEDEIDNDASYLFRAAMTTASGELVDYPLLWSVAPAAAGSINAATGRFVPDPEYIGVASLTARHQASGLSGSAAVAVFASICGDEAFDLGDGSGLRLQVPPGAVGQNVRISVSRRTPASVKRNAGRFRVDGQLYHFLPDGLEFTDGSEPTLTLPIPASADGHDLALGWWDPEELGWAILGAEPVGDGLERDLAHFSDYALLVANETLGLRDQRVEPNPFSPNGPAGGGAILFTISSQDMNQPLVDIEIFNLLGDPVRTLAEAQPMPIGSEQSVLWNGRTDNGDIARNGRYIVRITANDATGDHSVLLQAILIK